MIIVISLYDSGFLRSQEHDSQYIAYYISMASS